MRFKNKLAINHPSIKLEQRIQLDGDDGGDVTFVPSAGDVVVASELGIPNIAVSGDRVTAVVPTQDSIANFQSLEDSGNLQQGIANQAVFAQGVRRQNQINVNTEINSREGNRPDQLPNAGTSENVPPEPFTLAEKQEAEDRSRIQTNEALGGATFDKTGDNTFTRLDPETGKPMDTDVDSESFALVDFKDDPPANLDEVPDVITSPDSLSTTTGQLRQTSKEDQVETSISLDSNGDPEPQNFSSGDEGSVRQLVFRAPVSGAPSLQQRFMPNG